MPWPTPMHIVAAPRVPDGRAASWWTSVVRMRAPEQPSGWPRAIAPPSGLTRVGVETELGDDGERLGGERLVELDDLELVELPAGPFEGQPQRRRRTDAHPARLDPGRGPRHDARQRGQPVAGDAVVAGEQHRRGPVVERAGVAGGDRPVGGEHRLELRQPLEAGVGPRPLVRGDLGVADRNRHQLGVEPAGLAGRPPPCGGCRARTRPAPRGRSRTRRRAPRRSSRG